MESPVVILSLPLILIVVMSLIKMAKKKRSDGKPWFRIEKVEENESTSFNEIRKPGSSIIHI
jgi:hypothetical protein